MHRRTSLHGATAAGSSDIEGQQIQASVPHNPRTEIPLGEEFLTAPNPNTARLLPRVEHPGVLRGEMLYRPLGATGVEVSAIGMGGFHLGQPSLSDDESIRLIHQGLDRGITFIDNSWDYNNGRSEELVGKALSQTGYRHKAFVMTKLDGRTKQAAQQQLDESLRRLRVDTIDLLQHHEIIRFEDPDRIFANEGAMEAFLAAKQAGKIRFIGFTGHKDPHIHLYTLDVAISRGFHFDAVQLPLNVMDAHYRSFAQLVLPRLLREGIGVLGMKCFGDHVILKSNTVQPIEALHYSLNLPVSVLITGIESQPIMDQAFEAVKTFRPMNEQQVAALIAKTQKAALTGEFELFKTSAHFDATASNPQWLGEESPMTKALAPPTA
ncbi:MAG TPA: aldo/keto reductase [Acidobacteriaceae bacterium]|jgi:predicted aldo/keto reductase-like oxidoreductase